MDPLPLHWGATFDDLLFRRHETQARNKLRACHVFPDGKHLSITTPPFNYGTQEAPYEMMDHAGDIHAPLAEDDITKLLQTLYQPEQPK